MPMHDGHRGRLKNRFLAEGLDGFTDVQALELLLFYAIPIQDTNPLAHRLLERFGSLTAVLDAPVEELKTVDGIGDHAAALLHLIPQLERFYRVDAAKQEKILVTLEDCAAYLLPHFYGRKLETVFLLCLDAKCKVLCCTEIGEGNVNSAGISVRKIMETALNARATSVVLAHNHPSGIAVPSQEDILTTKRLAMCLQSVEVTLVDHIIVADDDYISMAQSGARFQDCLLI